MSFRYLSSHMQKYLLEKTLNWCRIVAFKVKKELKKWYSYWGPKQYSLFIPLTTERATFLGPSSYTCFVEHSDANTLSIHQTIDRCVRNHAMSLEYWYIYMVKSSAAAESLLVFNMQVKFIFYDHVCILDHHRLFIYYFFNIRLASLAREWLSKIIILYPIYNI